MNSLQFKYVFKCIVIGNPSVGKSCLLNQFLNGTFNEEYEITVGVEFGAKTIGLEGGERVKLQIWDTAGQESFKSVTRAYYRAAAVALLVYDITSKASFVAISQWLEECRIYGNLEMTLVLVGNKSDLTASRQVSFSEGEALANRNGMLFFETSAKTDQRVTETFTKSAEAVLSKINSGKIDPMNESSGVKVGPMAGVSESLMSPELPLKKGCC